MLTAKATKVDANLLSDVGMVREHNEDNAYADPLGMFYVVADGMGGHAAGEVASAMAVDEVRKSLETAREQIGTFAAKPSEEGRGQLVALLEESVRKAHQAVFERGGRETDKKGMGTTLDVLLIAGGEAFVAHVGDSRTYLLRGGAAAQVTTDHTVAEVLVIEGKLSPEEARLSPLRTILVNAIGVSPDVGVELAHLKLRRGDLLLLCSDGLHDYYPAESELSDLLGLKKGAAGLSVLVELAKERGGHDNITGVLVEVLEGNPTVEEEEAEARKAAAELAAQSPEDRAAAPTQLMGVEETAPHDQKNKTELPPDGSAEMVAVNTQIGRPQLKVDPHAGTLPPAGPPPKGPAVPDETTEPRGKDKAGDLGTRKTEEIPTQADGGSDFADGAGPKTEEMTAVDSAKIDAEGKAGVNATPAKR